MAINRFEVPAQPVRLEPYVSQFVPVPYVGAPIDQLAAVSQAVQQRADTNRAQAQRVQGLARAIEVAPWQRDIMVRDELTSELQNQVNNLSGLFERGAADRRYLAAVENVANQLGHDPRVQALTARRQYYNDYIKRQQELVNEGTYQPLLDTESEFVRQQNITGPEWDRQLPIRSFSGIQEQLDYQPAREQFFNNIRASATRGGTSSITPDGFIVHATGERESTAEAIARTLPTAFNSYLQTNEGRQELLLERNRALRTNPQLSQEQALQQAQAALEQNFRSAASEFVYTQTASDSTLSTIPEWMAKNSGLTADSAALASTEGRVSNYAQGAVAQANDPSNTSTRAQQYRNLIYNTPEFTRARDRFLSDSVNVAAVADLMGITSDQIRAALLDPRQAAQMVMTFDSIQAQIGAAALPGLNVDRIRDLMGGMISSWTRASNEVSAINVAPPEFTVQAGSNANRQAAIDISGAVSSGQSFFELDSEGNEVPIDPTRVQLLQRGVLNQDNLERGRAAISTTTTGNQFGYIVTVPGSQGGEASRFVIYPSNQQDTRQTHQSINQDIYSSTGNTPTTRTQARMMNALMDAGIDNPTQFMVDTQVSLRRGTPYEFNYGGENVVVVPARENNQSGYLMRTNDGELFAPTIEELFIKALTPNQ